MYRFYIQDALPAGACPRIRCRKQISLIIMNWMRVSSTLH